MPLSDSFSHATVREQEDEEEMGGNINENKKSNEDDRNTKIKFGNNESDLNSLAVRNLKNYCEIQDTTYWKEELEDMMESVKRVHKALSEGTKVEKVFRFLSEDFEDQKVIKSNDDITTFIEEIEKMDTILKVKVSEEKKVKLSRIQAEEKSRHILMSLPSPKTSGGMKVNLEEFMTLLNEVERIESGYMPCKPIEMNGVVISECFGDDVKDEEKKEKTTCQQRKANNLKFVERNIKLAKCGRGILSLTDEEKSRIESLLADVELSNMRMVKESKVSSTKSNSENGNEAYGIDNKTRSILRQIDERLEVMAEMRKTGHPVKIKWLKENESENKIFEEKKKIKENKKKGKREEKKQRNRLKKINELLNSINSISGEEIYPLTEEELEKLIRGSKESSSQELNRESALEEVRCPHKVITELVSDAKLFMPKFKYRFVEC